jgi:hypothetical protein
MDSSSIGQLEFQGDNVLGKANVRYIEGVNILG